MSSNIFYLIDLSQSPIYACLKSIHACSDIQNFLVNSRSLIKKRILGYVITCKSYQYLPGK